MDIKIFEAGKKYNGMYDFGFWDGETFTCLGRLFNKDENKEVIVFSHGGLYELFTKIEESDESEHVSNESACIWATSEVKE